MWYLGLKLPLGDRLVNNRLETFGDKDPRRQTLEEEGSEEGVSEVRSLTSARRAQPEGAQKMNVIPVGAALPANLSLETKDLLARIDQLEKDKVQLEEDKVELAKAITNLNELLKESRKVQKIQQTQIDDAERQGAAIIPTEVVEERQKVALKKSKSIKKKGRKRAAEVDEADEEEGEVFADNPELKKMVENLVPEENREDAVAEAKRVMLVHSAKQEDLEKEINRLGKENELLKKSLEELKKRSEDTEGATMDNLAEENKALIAQIKNFKKQNSELKDLNTSLVKEGSALRQVSDASQKNADGIITPILVGDHDGGPCQNCEKLKEMIHDLEERVAVLEEENIHLKDSLNKAQDKANKLDADLAEMRTNYSELASQKGGKKVDDVIKAQLEQLMTENKELKEVNQELDKKSQPTKRLEVKLDKKDKEIEKLHQKIEALQDKNADLEDKVGSPSKSPDGKSPKKQGAASSDTRALKAKEKEIEKLKSKVEKLEDRLDTLTITAEARKEEIKNLHTINKEQEKELKGMKTNLVTVGKDADKKLKKTEQLKEKQASEATAKAAELEKKLEASKGKMSEDYNKLKKDMQDMMADYENRLKILKDQSSMLNTQLDEAESGIKERDKEIKDLRKKIEEMGKVVGDAENLMDEHKEVKKQLKELTNEFSIVEVKYKEEIKKRKKLHNQIEDMKGKVRVFARARPMSKNELSKGCKFAVSIPDEMTIVVDTKNGPKKYNFDNCFGPESTQEEVFEESCALIQSAIDGFNVCVFAYGQTGSGKTFTIQGSPDNPGLTPRIFEELFAILDSMDNFEISLSCYMVELYMENLKDLLRPKKESEKALEIKKNAHGMVVVEGAHEIPIENLDQANKIFEFGLDNRKTASTNMNATSSRSHLVFSIVINSRNKQTGQRTVGKLSLVDLAGSERVSKTGADKERLKEAMAINKSLSALGNVISALGDGKKKHIPYRDNKLTMLMEDSLGGNAKTLMFVNVSPADYNSDETNTSLGYAKRVKNIKNFAVKNTQSKQSDKMNAIIMELQSEITRLEKKLEDGGIKFQRTSTNFNLGEGDDEGGDDDDDNKEDIDDL